MGQAEALQLDYRLPPVDLAGVVTLLYHFVADVPLLDDVERAQNAQLRVRLSPGAGYYAFTDGSTGESAGLHLLGPTSGAVRVRVDGPVVLVGLGLTADGWAALTGVDASSMTDRVVDGAALFGGSVDGLVEALQAADGVEARLGILADAVRRLMATHAGPAERFAATIDRWLSDCPSPTLDDLVAATGLSRRQLERRCKALYGLPPKLLARKYRALRAAVALASGSSAVDRIIADGFYDQSHLIRELKHFTGTTPRRLREHPTMLAGLTIARRRALEGLVAPIVSDT